MLYARLMELGGLIKQAGIKDGLKALGKNVANEAVSTVANNATSAAIDAVNTGLGNLIEKQDVTPEQEKEYNALAKNIPIPVRPGADSSGYSAYGNYIQTAGRNPAILRHEDGHRQVADFLGKFMGGRERAYNYTYLAPSVLHQVLMGINGDKPSKLSSLVYAPVVAHELAASSVGAFNAYKQGAPVSAWLGPYQGVATYGLEQAKPVIARSVARQLEKVVPGADLSNDQGVGTQPQPNAPAAESDLSKFHNLIGAPSNN